MILMPKDRISDALLSQKACRKPEGSTSIEHLEVTYAMLSIT